MLAEQRYKILFIQYVKEHLILTFYTTSRAVENGYTTAFTEDDACGLYVARGTQTLYSNVKLTAERDAATGDLVWKSKDNTTLVGGLSDEHYYLYYPY